MMLAGAALMVLLSCSSIAGLHVYRAAHQETAIAVRMALGASRRRLIRGSLIESTLLAAAGTLGALAVAWVVTRLLVASAPLDVPRLATASLGAPQVLAGMAALAGLVSVLSGTWPAIFVNRVDAGRTLVTGARTAMAPRERVLQRLVVGWQLAVAVLVLAGAALFVRSVQQLDRIALGFAADDLVSMTVEPAAADLDRWDQFYDALIAETRRIPGVTDAAAVYLKPLSGPIGNDTIPILEGQLGAGADAPWRRNARANLESVTPGSFRTLGTRVLAGRDFGPDDRTGTPGAVIVSASAAAKYWPGKNPIGQPIVVPGQRVPGTRGQPRWQTVVGVVEDVRYRGLLDPRLDVYLPSAQSRLRVKHLLVRSSGPIEHLTAAVTAIARRLDTGATIGEVALMQDAVARESAPWRFAMRVLAGVGALAAAIAAMGLMGLVSLVVTLRRRELGIRAALGATPVRLRGHVLGDAVWTMIVAVAAGLALATALGRVVASLLAGVPPNDPLSLAGAATVAILAGLAGCLVPARRAATTDPADVLRG
jgi:predicted permease